MIKLSLFLAFLIPVLIIILILTIISSITLYRYKKIKSKLANNKLENDLEKTN